MPPLRQPRGREDMPRAAERGEKSRRRKAAFTAVRILSTGARVAFGARAHWPRTCCEIASHRTRLLLLAAPGAAWAADATIVSQDLPIGVVADAGRRGRAAALRPGRRSTGRARARSSSGRAAQAGRWSGWQRAAPEDEDLPDPGSRRGARAAGLAARQPVLGRPVRPDRVAAHRRRSPAARLVRLEPGRPHAPVAPRLDGRLAADHAALGVERERGDPRAPPSYAKTVSFAIVHHTAGTNAYGPAPRRRSSAGSSCTTCAGTAGTTSATTSSSTATARCSRAAPAESTGT